MKLLRVNIISAESCGGLLDGLDLGLHSKLDDYSVFDPFCLVGPNGAGKSQFLQVIAEIFQSICNAVVPLEERRDGNPSLEFIVEYLIKPEKNKEPLHVRALRKKEGRRKPVIVLETKVDFDWVACDLNNPETIGLLPTKVVGYTSGDNQTLSLPFLISRSGYSSDVTNHAKVDELRAKLVPDSRLLLIDYGTHLEVLIANMLLSTEAQQRALLEDAKVNKLYSFRMVIQLAHGVVSKANKELFAKTNRREIQLTGELEQQIENLKKCSSCYDYEEKTETYIFDFWVNEATRKAFNTFWKSSLDLYAAFHKLAMLNDLALKKPTRIRFEKAVENRSFASRLPEPSEEEKVFRFEHVNFSKEQNKTVGYVSLSDGEHQNSLILGTLAMLSEPNIVFLLDEPESHFNPQWRVEFISRLRNLPTPNGDRQRNEKATEQECLLTTHAPFVPSDMRAEKVLIFSKEENAIKVKRPDIETFGSTFDTILKECFDVEPPISQISRDNIDDLLKSNDPEEIKKGMKRLGDSVEKLYLSERLRQLSNPEVTK